MIDDQDPTDPRLQLARRLARRDRVPAKMAGPRSAGDRDRSKPVWNLPSGNEDDVLTLVDVAGDLIPQFVPPSGGTTLVIQEGDSTVVTTAATLDFDLSDFNVTEAPSGEANITLAYGTSAGTPAEGNHTHTGTSAGITYGPIASLPSPSSIGALYYASDVPLVFIDTGTAWALQQFPNMPLTDPNLASLTTWVNQGGASVDLTKWGIRLTSPIGAANNWRMRVKTVPTAPYVVTALVWHIFSAGTGDESTGLVLRDSASSKLAILAVNSGSNIDLSSHKWTNETTFSALYGTNTKRDGQLVWLRISDDNTNRKFEFSYDGITWMDKFDSTVVTRTDFLTPNQIGFAGNHAFNSGSPHVSWLLSWKET